MGHYVDHKYRENMYNITPHLQHLGFIKDLKQTPELEKFLYYVCRNYRSTHIVQETNIELIYL